jgi:hypothetical protein
MTRDEAIALAHIFRATRPDCSRKMIREFRQWSEVRSRVAQFVEENRVMTGAAWSDLTEPTEREVWEKRKRKFPGD